MTVANRKQREKEEMRQMILDAAREIFLEKGYHQTSIRNIAERIEYSPGTIYLYYKEKDDIFHALHEEGFKRMLKDMEPLRFVQDPYERLKAMGRIYMNFARNNKDFYDLMFIVQAPMNMEMKDKWEMGDRTLEHLKAVIRDCQQIGKFKDKDVDNMAFYIWSTMHGMCALYCRDRCNAFEGIESDQLLDQGFKIFVEMLDKA